MAGIDMQVLILIGIILDTIAIVVMVLIYSSSTGKKKDRRRISHHVLTARLPCRFFARLP